MNPYERQQIATMATKVVDMLGDAEDALWELDDDTVVASVQEALARMCEYLAQVRDSLPKTDEERQALAANLSQALQEASNSSGNSTWRTVEEDRAAHELEERLASAVIDPAGREGFMRAMNDTRAQIRAELATSASRPPTAEEVSGQFKLAEAAVEELIVVLSTVERRDIEQIAETSMALARFATTAMRTAAMTVAVSALSEEEMGDLRRSSNRGGATVEEIECEGGEEEEHRFRRARLLWPPLRGMLLRGGGAAAVAVKKDAFSQMVLMVFALFCFPLWFPVIVLASLVLVPAIVIDELLQRVYEDHIVGWKVTARAEEALWAALSSAKVWFLMVRITSRQALRFASRQVSHARRRPGGLTKLAADVATGFTSTMMAGAGALAKDPLGPWRFLKGAAGEVWVVLNDAAAQQTR